MESERSKSQQFADKIHRLRTLKPRIRVLMKDINKGLRAPAKPQHSRHSSLDAGSYRQLQHSRVLYKRLFMDEQLKIEALNISENPKLKEMNQAIREKSEKNNKLILIFAELLDKKGATSRRLGSVALKQRMKGKDNIERFKREASPDGFGRRKKKGASLHSRCESCVSRAVQESRMEELL